MSKMFIDAHAHYEDKAFSGDLAEVLKKAADAGCEAIVDAAQDIPTARKIMKMTKSFPNIYAAVGVHPHCASSFNAKTLDILREMAADEKVVAIGEIGLDYHYDFSPRETQKEVFRAMIRLAEELKLPIVVHDREAHKDTLDILAEETRGDIGVLIHCFTASKEIARIIMDRGYYVSIGGAVTFKNARHIVEALEVIPEERILLETDCPYMTPVPHRGSRNDSSFIPLTAEKICEIKGVLLDRFYEITTKNAKNFYNLP